jgi:hypothetical protein
VTTTRASRHHEPDYALAVDHLMMRFQGEFSPDEVRAAVEDARDEVEPQSRIPDFLELLVERRAYDALLNRTRGKAPRDCDGH